MRELEVKTVSGGCFNSAFVNPLRSIPIFFGGGGETDPHRYSKIEVQNGFAIQMRNLIQYLPDYHSTEWGITLGMGPDGRPYVIGNIAISGNSGSSGVVLPADASNVFGFIHNHPAGVGATQADFDADSRYPSDHDWRAAQAFVDNGASAANLSLFIMDANADLRDFPYSDRNRYAGLRRTERITGQYLPDALV